MRLLGISAYYHDSAATLVVDGEIKIAVQEERFTRKKHDPDFPHKSIQYILSASGLKLSDLDAVVYYEKPWVKFDRILESYISAAPFGFRHFLKSFPLWIKHKLFLKQEVLRVLQTYDPQFESKKILFSEHHLSHAASAYYPSPFEDALVVTFDGVGEWATLSVGVGNKNNLEIHEELFFPHSLGLLYSTITAYCGFKVNSGEYKVMGLAPYGTPRFADAMLENLVNLGDDGSFRLNLKYFDFIAGDRMHSAHLQKLLNLPPRTPESPLEQVHMDLAASLQVVLETILLHILGHLKKRYPQENLCLAGGVALNCVANSKIKNSGLFKNIWIQPAAGDAGGSLGAALAAHHLHFKNQRRTKPVDQLQGMYLGPSFSEDQIVHACNAMEVPFEKLQPADVVSRTVSHLLQGDAIGWFQGKMEFGPRALGARSILADARNPDMQKRLNLKIKFRESFRPFAPIVCAEDVSKYFEWAGESPYMMFVANVTSQWRKPESQEAQSRFGLERLNSVRSEFPAITHLDYSARLQTVSRHHNPRLHELLSQFQQVTGGGILVNTSFNVRGEPIVCTPEDAISCFLSTDMDVLVMENILLIKSAMQGRKMERHFEPD